MPIPKVIHYCWFGGSPKPKLVRHCIRSWKKYCPEYQIIEWNEQNFDCSQSRYTQQAHAARKWAFVADYARLKVLHEQGGVYLDTDVELLRPLDSLLQYPAFFGFQRNHEVATGLGFGAEAGNPVVKALLDDYENASFLLPDGSFDLTPCPARNLPVFERFGLRADGTRQSTPEMEVFPAEYFCPVGYASLDCELTAETYSVHHYNASWQNKSRALRFDEEVVLPLVGPRFYYRCYRPFRCWVGKLRQKAR